MPKYIFITGGVVSSLGKGIAAASIGRLLEAKGFKITLIKCDPYINVDPGTMNPYQHGEVYVTDDGAEADLDLGHYERFTSAKIGCQNNITTGKVYYSVISKERKGEYLGQTVQIIPHITDEIKRLIKLVSVKNRVDVVIVEIGGTVGDIEGLPFLEAIRQLMIELGPSNVISVHVTLVPYIRSAGESKTKPTQHSVGKLREIGIQPNMLLCRSEKHLSKEEKNKIALFCNVAENAVIEACDVESVYEVPLSLKREKADELVLKLLNIKVKRKEKGFSRWENDVIERLKNPSKEVRVAVVGKYISLQDAYKSIYEALLHGAIANRAKLNIIKVDSENITKNNVKDFLNSADSILIPGGFGNRGVEGKIEAVRYARENSIPFLGICLGMQSAVIEFARNVCGLENANSTEFSKDTPYPVIFLLEEQKKIDKMGATMRLGSYPCVIKKGSKSFAAYKKEKIAERHRHRYELNSKYKEIFKQNGMIFSGINPESNLVEIVELNNHPWFVACQFHPEFKSKPDMAHPLFRDFVKAALE